MFRVGGYISDIVGDRIYEVYGHQQSTAIIINNMRKDRITYNCHAYPALRIANL
jgi:hypothetical protein